MPPRLVSKQVADEFLGALIAITPDGVVLSWNPGVDPLTTELDGFAFLSQFRKSPTGRRVPIILCTLREIAPAELRRHLASAQSVLQQGEDGAKLIEAVAEAGGQRHGW